jgi:hypothetical protein
MLPAISVESCPRSRGICSLVQLNQAGLVAFKSATMLEDLRGKAKEKTDLQAAQEMQKAKADLFAMFNKSGRKGSA